MPRDDFRFDRAFVVQIHDANFCVLLAEAVNTTNSLFNAHRIPRHVVVDERTAKLKVEALGCGIRAKQHVGLAGAEAAFGFFA